MDEVYITSRNRKTNMTNRHYFEFDIFNTVLDMQIQEFGDRFGEVSTELLSNISALSPRDSFSMFDKKKLMNLSKMYPCDFTHTDREKLDGELDVYYDIIRCDEKFASLNGITDFSRLMVETGKHISYRYVYRLLKLALVLPVATATVERCFSAMKLVKSELRNRMGDDFLNDCLIGAIEKEALFNTKDESVMKRFQKMEDRRGQLN
ncbi:uncharacterized protein [Rutidosis leptorrhynchoides]|uniref:uncharacterized protein n=1 Tax=Rutidosis leptorrhynchoides TaxID=125765 RepID=UPI003A9926D1